MMRMKEKEGRGERTSKRGPRIKKEEQEGTTRRRRRRNENAKVGRGMPEKKQVGMVTDSENMKK